MSKLALGDDFARGVRQAQASRGLLFGGAAVSQEASGLAAFSAQLRQQLLPQAMAFARAPEDIRQSVLGFEAPLRVAARTGAAIPGITPPQILDSPLSAAFKQAAAGAAGGYQIGSSLSQPAGSPPPPPAQGDQFDTTGQLRQQQGFNPFSQIQNLNDIFAGDEARSNLGIPFEQSAVSRLGGLV